jgi:monothiol glutaredoxin
MTRDVMKEIQSEIDAHPIVLYMKGDAMQPRCGFSAAVVEILVRHGKPFHAINVLEDPEKWAAVKEFSDWPTIPQLYVAQEFIGGCDITRELDQKGQLGPMLEKASGALS